MTTKEILVVIAHIQEEDNLTLKMILKKKVYQQSEDHNLTTKNLLKNDTVSLVKDVRTLTLEKNKNKNEVENNKETIDELEVIRRRYSKI